MGNIETIKCACGCGQLLPKYDERGRIRKFINGHQIVWVQKRNQERFKKARIAAKEQKYKTCTKCKQTKTIDKFPENKKMIDGRHSWCRLCHAKYGREYRKKYPKRVNTKSRQKYNRDRQRTIRKEIKEQIINKLGKKCVKCGNEDFQVLQIDHINDDGSNDPYKVKDYTKYYQNLLSLPDKELFANYQLLCANCNWIKRYKNTSLKLINKNISKRVILRLGKRCVNCGETDIRTLQIDHIHGEGLKDKKRFKNIYHYYNYLLSLSDEELFKNYQCLCANCNWIKRYENKEL